MHISNTPPYGWQAVTRINLDFPRSLEIKTYKTSNGILQSNATVYTETSNGMISHTMNYGFGHGDFASTIIRNPVSRNSEKLVRTQHEQALAMLYQIKIDIAKHYEEAARLASSEA